MSSEKLRYYKKRYFDTKDYLAEVRKELSQANERIEYLESENKSLLEKLGEELDKNSILNIQLSKHEDIEVSDRATFVDIVVSVVAKAYEVDVEDILMRSRVKECAIPRQVAHYIACSYSESPSLSYIGKKIGGLTHCTVVYSRDKVRQDMEIYPDYRQLVTNIRERVTKIMESRTEIRSVFDYGKKG